MAGLNDNSFLAQFGTNGGGGGGGSVNSVTGLNTDNTDPTNPIVEISVDGSTITGAGTPASPLVANIGSNKLLVSYHMNNNFSPSGNNTYYFGQQSSIGSSINQAVAVPIPAGTLTEVITNTYVAGSFGSSEGSTFTLWTNTNSGTPTTDVIATGVQFPSANPRNLSQSFTGLSISVVTGGSFIQVDTPTFTSAPSSVQIRVSLIIEL
jgi:hypothetical protein